MRDTTPDAPLLSLRQVAVAAGGGELLRGIDLDVEPGELVAVTGPSGAGKTTLLRAVCGLDDASAGELLLQGRSAADWGWPQFRRHVVLVEQRPVLFDETIEHNLRRPFTYATGAEPFPHDTAIALLDRLGIGAERLAQNARSLSVGQQQRLCLIRALLVRPVVLLLDEPTSALDRDAVALVEDFIREIAEQQRVAALIVTHDPRQAAAWCRRQLDVTGCMVAREPA